jgi:hypothetical protein
MLTDDRMLHPDIEAPFVEVNVNRELVAVT